MGERRQIARGANAALARDDRHGIVIDQRLERVDDREPDARIAAAETEQLEDDHQPDDVARQRFAEAATVREDEIALQLSQPVGGNAGVGEQAEAGVDAIDGLSAGDDPFDRRGGGGDAIQAGGVESRVGAAPQLAERCEIDGFRIQLQPTLRSG